MRKKNRRSILLLKFTCEYEKIKRTSIRCKMTHNWMPMNKSVCEVCLIFLVIKPLSQFCQQYCRQHLFCLLKRRQTHQVLYFSSSLVFFISIGLSYLHIIYWARAISIVSCMFKCASELSQEQLLIHFYTNVNMYGECVISYFDNVCNCDICF